MIILGLLVISTIFFITTYNKLVKQRNDVDAAFSTIDIMLKKRHDLIPNLVASVKSMMSHEKGLLEKVTELRSQAVNAGKDLKQREDAENQLSAALGQLQVTMENYPEIKSDKNVLQLQAALNDIEEQISATRRVYNNTVRDYNNSLQTFPSNVVAGTFNFKSKQFFEITAAERENVDVAKLMNF